MMPVSDREWQTFEELSRVIVRVIRRCHLEWTSEKEELVAMAIAAGVAGYLERKKQEQNS
jgi:hypothetical protein